MGDRRYFLHLLLAVMLLTSETACSRWNRRDSSSFRTRFPAMLDVLEDPDSSQQELMRVTADIADHYSEQLAGGSEDFHWLARLRAMLRRELDEPILRRPPGASCPTPPEQGCQLVFDGCTPRAAYIAWAVESVLLGWQLDVDSHPEHWVEMRAALQRGDARLTPRALEAMSGGHSLRDVRLSMGAGNPSRSDNTEVVEPLLQLLAIPECRLYALSNLELLRESARTQMMAPILAMVDAQEKPSVSLYSEALRVFGVLNEEEAWAPLRRALESNHSELQLTALTRLGKEMRQRHAAELMPILETVMQSTRSPDVWREAREHLWRIGFSRIEQPRTDNSDSPPLTAYELDEINFIDFAQKHPVPAPTWMRCPRMKELGEDREIEFDGEAVRLRPADHSFVKKGLCSRLPDTRGADLLEPLGTACIVGHDYGEFGGGFSIHEKDSLSVLWQGVNPQRLVHPQGSVAVLTGIVHLAVSQGLLLWLERLGSGEWRIIRTTVLPGWVAFYGYTRGGDLILAIPGDEDCSSQGLFSGNVLRVTSDGQLVGGE